MLNLKQILPPLEPLVAFEAAARHLSFTLAAQELNLSQAAISQQIRNLEQALGKPLFLRSHRAIRLTGAGMIYLNAISASLKQIASATDEYRQPSAQSRITVATDQSVATMWLMPRLPEFNRIQPVLGVRLIASDMEQDLLAEDIDIAIVHGDGQWPGYSSELLFSEEVFPVCSPDYLKTHSPVSSADDLLSHKLLNLESTRWSWMDWRIWFGRQNIHKPIIDPGLQMNNYPLLIEAARLGQGIALGWRYLIDEYLKNGDLIAPLPGRLKTRYGYYIVWRQSDTQMSNTEPFRQWLIGQVDTR